MERWRVERALEVWKTCVEVQQHFNDIELRVRQFALAILAAVLAASVATMEFGAVVEFLGIRIGLSTLVLLAGALVWLAFYFVDRVWYHPLLIGAVRQAESIENELQREVLGIGLTKRISRESPVTVRGVTIHARHKMDVFYVGVFVVLLIISLGAHYATASGNDGAGGEGPVEQSAPGGLMSGM